MLFVYWFLIGLASTFLAIYIHRNDGSTVTKGELYLAAIGPLFGPIVLVLLGIDEWEKLYNKFKNNED